MHSFFKKLWKPQLWIARSPRENAKEVQGKDVKGWKKNLCSRIQSEQTEGHRVDSSFSMRFPCMEDERLGPQKPEVLEEERPHTAS